VPSRDIREKEKGEGGPSGARFEFLNFFALPEIAAAGAHARSRRETINSANGARDRKVVAAVGTPLPPPLPLPLPA